MYSKSQTSSPKLNGFLTALPSSISAPSLLVLQQQPPTPTVLVSTKPFTVGSSHRKYNTLKHNSSKDFNNNKQQQQQQQQQQQPNHNKKTNNSNGNCTTSTTNNSNCNSNKKYKFHKKMKFLNNNKQQQNNLNTTNIIITSNHDDSIINSIENITINDDSDLQQKENQQEKEKEENLKEQEQQRQYDDDEFKEEIYPFSMDEETLGEYFNFLSILSDYIEHQIDDSAISVTNINNGDGDNDNEAFRVFNVDQEPEISIYNYILRIFKYLPFGTDIFIFSIIYLDRIIEQNPKIKLSYLNIHRLFMASVLVASKYHNDKSLNNRYYAQVGGVTLSEMNLLEIKFLLLSDWNLLITTETFNSYNDLIQQKIKILNNNDDKKQLISINNESDNKPKQQQQQQQPENKCIISDNNNNSKVENTLQFNQSNFQPITINQQYPQHNYYNSNHIDNNNNNNNNFSKNIQTQKSSNRHRPNYLTYPMPANQYNLYQYQYQQPPPPQQQPIIYHQTYDDQNIYYGYNNYQQPQFHCEQSLWQNGSYYYLQQQQQQHPQQQQQSINISYLHR